MIDHDHVKKSICVLYREVVKPCIEKWLIRENHLDTSRKTMLAGACGEDGLIRVD